MNQNTKVMNYMEDHPSGITAKIATDQLHVYRLAARIKELRNKGMPIADMTQYNPENPKEHWKVYWLDTPARPTPQ